MGKERIKYRMEDCYELQTFFLFAMQYARWGFGVFFYFRPRDHNGLIYAKITFWWNASQGTTFSMGLGFVLRSLSALNAQSFVEKI